jgi:hypothetical protein
MYKHTHTLIIAWNMLSLSIMMPGELLMCVYVQVYRVYVQVYRRLSCTPVVRDIYIIYIYIYIYIYYIHTHKHKHMYIHLAGLRCRNLRRSVTKRGTS